MDNNTISEYMLFSLKYLSDTYVCFCLCLYNFIRVNQKRIP